MMDQIEAALGIKIAHGVAGIAGGTVRALISGGGFFQAVTSVICGSLTAAYLTSPVYSLSIHWFPGVADKSTEYACGYLVGLTAMFIAEGVIRYARKWAKNPTIPTPG